MKESLKYINITGYGVLVDENPNNKKIGDIVWNKISGYIYKLSENPVDYEFKILFAEKELNLNVSILPNWKEWEVEKLSKKVLWNKYPYHPPTDTEYWLDMFKEGYNHNKAKYTEEDLIQAFAEGHARFTECEESELEEKVNEYIQSIQKEPKYIVMESELKEINPNSDRIKYLRHLKLIINSDGKQEGIIKEIIW